MGLRTCQLCGKALSRIWVGAGGDFCSREHRNQYRLRLGMDRLQEANKVATLMRRRENLKPVRTPAESAHSLMHRAYLDGAAWAEPRRIGQVARRLEPWGLAQLPSRNRGRHSPLLQAGGEPVARCHDYVPTRQSAPRLPFVPQSRSPLEPVGMLPAGAVETRRRSTRPPDKPHGYGAWLATGARLEMKRLHGRGLAGAATSRDPARPAPIAPAPRPGLPLRVSSSYGFRLEQPRMPASRPAAMTTPRLRRPSWRTVNRLLTGGPAPVPACAAVPLPHPGLRLVSGPPAERKHAVRTGAARLARGRARNRQAEPYTYRLEWPPFEQAPAAQAAFGKRKPRSECGAWQSIGARALPLAAMTGEPTPELAIVPFEPQELPFGYSALEIQTAMPSVPATAEKPRTETQAPAAIEEHFDAGWRNWIGGTADWRLDAAGARTGSLALFAPSLDLTDYDLEFLARVDQSSVTWVFRATDENEYHLAAIANTPGGRTFTRSTVIDGAPGLRVTKPLRGPANPKAAITVQTRVRGNEFEVWVDGETIDRWTDSRLPIGGIGFMSPPEDRARLYWVRVSPADGSEEKDRP